LFAMSLCSFWDPRRLQIFYIDGIYFIITIVTMTFITSSNYNTVDNIYVKSM